MMLIATMLAFVGLDAHVDANANITPTCGYSIENRYPHDPKAFTQGLFFHNGVLYENVGEWRNSSIRQVDLQTGQVVKFSTVTENVFGEGAAAIKDIIYSITWQSGKGYMWDADTLDLYGTFKYEGEGWGLTSNGYSLMLSDGSNTIKVMDPTDLKVLRTLSVTVDGQSVERINELEWIEGRVLANIWQSEKIAIINADSGAVEEWLDLSGLRSISNVEPGPDNVLNGIAYDDVNDRLFVTGKNWPWLYQIKPSPDCNFQLSKI